MTHEEANKILSDAFNGIWQVYGYLNSEVQNVSNKRVWISPEEAMPADNELVLVKTKDGAKYFGRSYEGRLMPNIEYWYPLPEE